MIEMLVMKEMNVYDPDDFTGAPHLNQVLEETLRLTPALYFFPRKATVAADRSQRLRHFFAQAAREL